MLTLPEIVARVRAAVERQPLVNGVYLFGSQASGEARTDSDVDLGVLFFECSTLDQRVDLELLLSDALERRVDLVDLGQCGAYLALEAIRGERIYAADPVLCDEFDLYVMRRAADLAPFERERRRIALDPSTVRQATSPRRRRDERHGTLASEHREFATGPIDPSVATISGLVPADVDALAEYRAHQANRHR